jgi:hypothetical protein
MIVKTCKHHGELTQENIRKRMDKRYGRERIAYTCDLCDKYRWKIYYEKNKEIRNQRNKEYLIKNPEKKSYSVHKKYQSRNPEKWKDARSKYHKRQRENLSDEYIKKLISRYGRVSYKDVPKNLIELKRNIYLLKKKIINKEENT